MNQQAPSSHRPTRIMVTEDERIIAMDLQTSLEDIGYEVTGIANTGEGAIALADETRPDLVFMDIMLIGEMSGIEAAARIYSQFNIPVIYLSAYVDDAKIERAKLTRPFGYLVKPFKDEELKTAIETALYRHQLETRIEHLNRVLLAIRNVNRAITQHRDRSELAQAICDQLVESRGYLSAWIALYCAPVVAPPPPGTALAAESGERSEDRTIDLLTQAFAATPAPLASDADTAVEPASKRPSGGDSTPLPLADMNWRIIKTCIASALATATFVLVHPDDDGYDECPFALDATENLTIAMVRLEHRDRWYGALIVTVPPSIVVDDEERMLITEVADDIGLALYSLEQTQQRKFAQEQVRQFFELTSELLAIVEPDTGAIVAVNPAFAASLGVPSEELVNQPVLDHIHPHDRRKAAGVFSSRDPDAARTSFDCRVLDRNGATRALAWTINHNASRGLIYAAARDVTKQREAELKLRRRLMRYDLEPGYCYLALHRTPHHARSMLNDLLLTGYDGVVISRTPEPRFRAGNEGGYFYWWLTDQSTSGPDPTDLRQLQTDLLALPRNQFVFIERLDYLLGKNGVGPTTAFVAFLSDFAYLYDALVLLALDPRTVADDVLRSFQQECREPEQIHKSVLSEDLFDLLTLAMEQSQHHRRTSYDVICDRLGISRPTARKRLAKLIYFGYLDEVTLGRKKVFEITEKGISVLTK